MELNLQLFAYAASAVKGSRLFISESLPIVVADAVDGVKETSDKGGDTNKVDVTTIADTADKEALGTVGTSDNTYTFFYAQDTFDKQASLIGKEVYIYEETVDSSATPDLIGNGTVYKATLGGIVLGGASSNTERTFTQTAVRVGDDIYHATVSGEAGSQTFTYTALSTGLVETDI